MIMLPVGFICKKICYFDGIKKMENLFYKFMCNKKKKVMW